MHSNGARCDFKRWGIAFICWTLAGYAPPPRALVIFKVKLALIKGRGFSPFRGTYIHMLLQNIYRIIACVVGLTLFYHIKYKDGMYMSLEFY